MRLPAICVLSLLCIGLGGALRAAELSLADKPHLRRPVAAAWLDGNKLLAVANQRSGSISIVDIENREVLAETAVGERLADVAALPGAALPGAGWLLAVDERRHELLLLQWDAGKLQVVERMGVSRYPVSIAVSPDGSRCTVASLWSRTITTFEIKAAEDAKPPTVTKLGELVLDFAPGEQLYLPDGQHVLVADAFTGQMAVVDMAEQRVYELRSKYLFRIYGMALSADQGGFYIAHQTLAPLRVSQQPVGAVGTIDKAKQLTNFIGEYSLEGLVDGRLTRFIGNPEKPSMPGYFTGDLRKMDEFAPALLSVTTENRRQVIAAAAGQPQVRLRRFQDDLFVSDPAAPGKQTTISLGPVPALTAANRGEALFYDTSLSANGWMSCNTCHPDGHTTSQLVDTLGDDTKGTHKRALTLLGSGQTGKWAWNGEARTLKSQVFQSLKSTMKKQSNAQIVSDITAFLETLPPPPPLKPATDDPADQAQLARGEALFGKLGCAQCHVPESGYTSDDAYDVGLRDEKNMTKFNPPSLRGVSQGYSFFHDGRATRLEEVFTTHHHPHGEPLDGDQLADLLRFLSSL